jgi:hypothetical protein
MPCGSSSAKSYVRPRNANGQLDTSFAENVFTVTAVPTVMPATTLMRSSVAMHWPRAKDDGSSKVPAGSCCR